MTKSARIQGTAGGIQSRCPKAPGCSLLGEGPAGQPKGVCGLAREMGKKALVSALDAIDSGSKVRAAKKLAEMGGVSEIEPLARACAGLDREKMVPELRKLVERHGEEGLAELGRMAGEADSYGPVLSAAQAASAVQSPKAVEVLAVVAERAGENRIYGEPPKTGRHKDMQDFVRDVIDLRATLYDAVLKAVQELGVPACSALVLGEIIDSPDSSFYGMREKAVRLLGH